MANYPLPYFDQIDLSALEEYYNVETTLGDNKISLDINFESNSIDENSYQDIKAFLESIEKFDEQNKLQFEKDFKENGEALDYINFYLDELDEEQLAGIIDNSKPKERQLLNKLRLVRVGLYPDGKFGSDYFGAFDYSIDINGEPCNQLLVVKTDRKGQPDHISWES